MPPPSEAALLNRAACAVYRTDYQLWLWLSREAKRRGVPASALITQAVREWRDRQCRS